MIISQNINLYLLKHLKFQEQYEIALSRYTGKKDILTH